MGCQIFHPAHLRAGSVLRMKKNRLLILLAITVLCGNFGCSREKTPEATTAPIISAEPPEPQTRFRVPSRAPFFAPPFFSTNRTLHGNIPILVNSDRAAAGILVDINSHEILWEKELHKPVPIASVSKLMTCYVVFDKLETDPTRSFSSLVTASTACTRVGKVKANIRPGEKIPLDDLLKLLMLRSANDSAVLIAEFFGDGDSANFIEDMNEACQTLGMKDSHFVNPNGLPIYGRTADDVEMNRASVYDMMILSERLLEYPRLFNYTALEETVWSTSGEPRRLPLHNGNGLLGKVQGVDGLKTGFTNAAGYCLAFSCLRNGRRLMGLVTGLPTRKSSEELAISLIDYGFLQQQVSPSISEKQLRELQIAQQQKQQTNEAILQ